MLHWDGARRRQITRVGYMSLQQVGAPSTRLSANPNRRPYRRSFLKRPLPPPRTSTVLASRSRKAVKQTFQGAAPATEY